MTIGEAASRFGVDGATIWAWISSGRIITLRGEAFRLEATERDKLDRWIVRKVAV